MEAMAPGSLGYNLAVGATAQPNIPQAQNTDTGEAPEISGTAAGLGGSLPQSGVAGPAKPTVDNPSESIARHVLDALGGGSGHPLDWARSIVAGGLTGAANVGKVPEGGGFLAGAGRGFAGVQAQQRQQMLDRQEQAKQQQEMQLKQKADVRAEQELANSTDRTKAEVAMYTAQKLRAQQETNQAVELEPYLVGEKKVEFRNALDAQQKLHLQDMALLKKYANISDADMQKFEHYTDAENVTPSTTKLAGSGAVFPLHNGELPSAGNDKVGNFVIPADKWNVPLTEDTKIITGYEQKKDGTFDFTKPQYTTLSKGHTMGDVHAISLATEANIVDRMGKLTEQAKLQHEQAGTQHEQAETSHVNAETELTKLQAKQYLTDETPNALGDVGGVDPATGAALSPKEASKRFDSFNQKVLQPLQTNTDKSFRMAQQAFSEYQAAGGKLPTGAQSMLMLSNHLSTTFGNVKGARVTKDMIEHHLGARGISDRALVAVQKLTNHDELSPDQWKAFMDLIGQSREFSYAGAIDNARSTGLGKSIQAWLPKAPANGAKIDGSTARIYLYAAHGDPNKALDAAKAAGWGVQ